MALWSVSGASSLMMHYSASTNEAQMCVKAAPPAEGPREERVDRGGF